MKKIILSFLGLAFGVSLSAQVNEASYSMSLGSQNGLKMEFPGVNVKDVEDQWVEFTKEHFKTKAKKNKAKEYFCDDAEIKYFTGTRNTVDVYAQITGGDTNASVTVWYDLGGAFLNSDMHKEDYVEAEKLMYKFALEYQKHMIEEKLKEKKKNLKKIESDLEKLQKNKEGYEKDIEEYKQKIEERIQSIEQNVKDQAQTEADIQTQKKVIEQVQQRLKELD